MRYLTSPRTAFWCLVLAVVAIVTATVAAFISSAAARQARHAETEADDALTLSKSLTAVEARPRLTVRPVAIPRAEAFLRATPTGGMLRLEARFAVVNWGDAAARDIAASGPVQIDGGALVRQATGQVDVGSREPLKPGQVRPVTLWVTLTPVSDDVGVLSTLVEDIEQGRWQVQVQMLIAYLGEGASRRLYRTACVSRIASDRASLEFEHVE